jgi:AraC-like DNA-binding protein
MMTTLLEWQPGSVSESLQRDSREVLPRHVRLVEDYIRAHPEQPITIEQLTELAGVSGRTLYSGFQKFRGVSPMRYLRDVRMERVRSDLLDPPRPAASPSWPPAGASSNWAASPPSTASATANAPATPCAARCRGD